MKKVFEIYRSDYKVEKDVAQVYKIRGNKNSDWATITIREWKGGGSIDIQSDSGNFSYSWSAIGEGTFKYFLCDLSYDYFFGKASSNRGYEFSINESVKAIQRDLIMCRKQNTLSKKTARSCWNNSFYISKACSASKEEYTHMLSAYPCIMKKLYKEDYNDIPYIKHRDLQCVAFWDKIWPVVCEVWKKEDFYAKHR